MDLAHRQIDKTFSIVAATTGKMLFLFLDLDYQGPKVLWLIQIPTE